jgi:MFS family permease
MTSAVILGMIVTMFPDSREQAKAIGVFAFVASAGGSIGLLLGGVITQVINWHWIFFVNIPIGIATAVAARRLVAKDRGMGFGSGADIPGAVLITSGLMLAVYTIVKPAAEDGWGASTTLLFGAGSLALIVAFVAREATASNPLIPLRIFRSRNVTGANVIQALTVAGMFGTFFLGTLYLQRILGYDALETGLAFLPTSLVMGTMSLKFSDRLIMRFGARTTLIPGLALVAASLAWLARAPVDGDYWTAVFPSMIVLGAGVGSAFPALMTLSMSGATPQDAGLASGLVNTTMQVGGALGLAVLATLAATRTKNSLGDGHSHAAALASGFHLAFLIGALLVVASLVVAVTVLQPVRRAATSASPESIEAEPAYSEFV